MLTRNKYLQEQKGKAKRLLLGIFQILASRLSAPKIGPNFCYRKSVNNPKHWGFPGGSGVKNMPAGAGDPRETGSVSELGVGNGNALQCLCLEKSMDRRVWWVTVHRVTQGWTQQGLSKHESSWRVVSINLTAASHGRTCFYWLCYPWPSECFWKRGRGISLVSKPLHSLMLLVLWVFSYQIQTFQLIFKFFSKFCDLFQNFNYLIYCKCILKLLNSLMLGGNDKSC